MNVGYGKEVVCIWREALVYFQLLHLCVDGIFIVLCVPHWTHTRHKEQLTAILVVMNHSIKCYSESYSR